MKIKNVVLGIAIIILTIFVTFYGINTFYPKPIYEDFCGEFGGKTAQLIENQAQCDAVEGKWEPQEIRCITDPCPQGYCDRDYQCRNEFEEAMKVRSRNVFFVALPLGIVIIVLGAFIFGLEVVGAGLMGGGVGTLIYGAGAYWPYSKNWIRFLISLVGLAVLIFFAYWFNNRAEKKKKKFLFWKK